jgi:hypothetical protein
MSANVQTAYDLVVVKFDEMTPPLSMGEYRELIGELEGHFQILRTCLEDEEIAERGTEEGT